MIQASAGRRSPRRRKPSQGGIDEAPRQWPRRIARLGSHLGTVPASGAHHYRRARPLGEGARQNTAGAAC
eukprot:scaffold72584_cov75-Phaeocystis_antarctica.AAC.2